MWTVIELTLPRSSVDRVEVLLELAGAAAVTLTDAGDSPLLEPAPGETPVWPEVCIEALFASPIQLEHLGDVLNSALGETVALRERTLLAEDWQNAWRQHWQPLTFGGRLTVTAGEDSVDAAHGAIVRLTPGLAFGTGQHPTTALCLQWLVDQDLTGRTVFDYGTGSGVLAIAAARLGAAHVYAVDIDPQALLACDDNARRNAVRQQLTIGAPADLVNESADILIANILAETLKTLAPQLARQVISPGDLVLSGILAEQADDVAAAYHPWFEFVSSSARDGWVHLVGQPRADIK